MGFDISYHPITAEEINQWYFDVLENMSKADELGNQHQIDPFYINKYKDTLKVGQNTGSNDNFDKTHSYYIAVIQGFFRTYFYTRGSAYSFLIAEDDSFAQYTTSWNTFIPEKYKSNPKAERVVENYSGGVYFSPEQVNQLLHDFSENTTIQQKLMEFFSDGRIEVFINALKFAAENKLGLIEASEVVEPNPLDLNKSVSYSNLFNCDKEGAFLYREAALEQIREIEKQQNLKEGEISNNASYKKVAPEEPAEKEKKGFWKRLFGK